MGYAKSLWGVSFLLLLAVGCGDDAEPERPPATRSAACTAFQDAACEFGERCGKQAIADCLPASRMTFCTSDEAAASCTTALSSAPCGPPVACATEVLDEQPAIDICNEYLENACDWIIRCNSTVTREQCDAEFSTRVNCSLALGVTKDHDLCFEALAAASCEISELPSECDRLIAVGR